MRFRKLLLTAAAVGALGVAAPAGHAAAKPGFPAGIWNGTGVISGKSSEYGQTVRTTGRATFTLQVTRGGRVSGPATLPTYAGTQTVTTAFSDGVRGGRNTITKLPFKGGLRITRAGHCRVTGSRTTDGVSFKWTALLRGSGTCNT